MGVAYYPELNPKIRGYKPDLAVDGKMISVAIGTLDEWATELGVHNLSSFYSESNKEVFAHIGEDAPPDLEDTPIRWSKPSDGLKTVRALIARLAPLGDRNVKVKSDSRKKEERDHRSVTDCGGSSISGIGSSQSSV